ncbi:MAG: hypothetical protein EA362_09415 [Saprospirales bacterium]|nr:MAG: hypothetical protein EA362_09415 [Saprospirales bacterium]
MFGKLKKILGVEGVKLELEIPDEVSATDGLLEGVVHFYSMSAQKVTIVNLVFKERYRRGRGKDKLIDEYELGAIELKKVLQINKDEPAELPFSIPFKVFKSRMDEFEQKNLFTKGIAKAAKLAKNVKSEYILEAKANVEGTVLHPIAKKVVQIVS